MFNSIGHINRYHQNKFKVINELEIFRTSKLVTLSKNINRRSKTRKFFINFILI